MPIKGLLDTPRLPRIGKIHLGVKMEKGDTSYPKAVDYFVVPQEVQQALKEEKPQKLRIAFPCEDPGVFASHFYRAYSSYRGLVCRGDGEKARRLCDVAKVVGKGGSFPDDKHPMFWPLAGRDAEKTAHYDILCPPDSCQEYGRKQCRPVMNLQVLLLDVPGLGVWQIDTSSWESMRNILNTVAHIKQYGKISLIPLILSLVSEEAAPDGVKQRVYRLHLTAPYSLSQLYEYLKLPPGQALLPEPDAEAPEDLIPEDVQDGQASPGDESKPIIILGAPSVVTPAAASGTQASAPRPSDHQAEVDLFTLLPQEQKERLWLEVRRLLRETETEDRPEKLQEWFQKRNCPVALTELKADRPPMLVTLKIITELRDNLVEYKRKMAQQTPKQKPNLL